MMRFQEFLMKKKKMESQKEGSFKINHWGSSSIFEEKEKRKVSYSWRTELFHSLLEVLGEKKVSEIPQFDLEERFKDFAEDAATSDVLKTKIDQNKEEVQEKVSTRALEEPASNVEKKGKSVLVDEEDGELTHSSSIHKSNIDEDLEETMQKILEEMKNSKEKNQVEDTNYVPSPVTTLESSHCSDNILLKH